MTNDIHPIRTEADYLEAVAEVERLWGSAPGTPEGDRLDILMDLVEAYDRRHPVVFPHTPVDAIRFAMEQKGLRPVDLGKILGSTPRAYEVLSGKRGLSIAMIRALHVQWGIPLESLVAAA